MAEINKTQGTTGVGIGILHPLQKHQFFVRYKQEYITEVGGELLTKQTVAFNLNAKDDEITIKLEQPKAYAAEFLALISTLAHERLMIVLESTISLEESMMLAKFKSAVCTHHEFDLTYTGGSEIAIHELTYKYDSEQLFEI